jgi:NADH:ubiquinone oxidoreductase subunit 4 (subunit M)
MSWRALFPDGLERLLAATSLASIGFVPLALAEATRYEAAIDKSWKPGDFEKVK